MLRNEAEVADKTSMCLFYVLHKNNVYKVTSSNIIITNGTLCIVRNTQRRDTFTTSSFPMFLEDSSFDDTMMLSTALQFNHQI
jgi:hypothetical protein